MLMQTIGVVLLARITLTVLLFHTGQSMNWDEYLYVKTDDVDPSFPIMEYKTQAKLIAENKWNNTHPDFLYDTNYPYPRVVEFYAPWCPHCLHFRESFIGFARNITASCQQVNVTLQVFTVSCMAHRDLCRAQGISSYPRVKLIPANSVNFTEIEYWNLHPFQIFRTFGIKMEEYELPETVALKPKSVPLRKKKDPNDVATMAPTRHVRTKEELYSDVFASFDFAMRNSIFMINGPLSADQKLAFWNWLQLLQKSLPPFWSLQNAIYAILNNFEQASESEAGLLRIISQYPPPSRSWSAACPSGYTCGLWEMFHVMTVGVVEYNKLAVGGQYLPTNEAADHLRDYIKHFFACDVCRAHFLEEYDTCSHDRCNRLKAEAGTTKDWMELPLWLFEEHNAVNVRLLHEAAERTKQEVTSEKEIGVQWPSRAECPTCWLDEQRWDEDNVYRFLRLNYWIHDAESVGIQRELLSSAPKTRQEDDGDLHPKDRFHKLVPLSFAAVVLLFGIGWYQKEHYLRKSGYHKKNEG